MGIKGSPTSWSVSQSDVRTVGVTDTDRQADGQDLDGGFQREQRPSVTITLLHLLHYYTYYAITLYIPVREWPYINIVLINP